MDHQMTNQWLKRAGLKSETEGFLINAHDQAIKSNYYSSNCKILKDGTDQTQCAEFVVNFRKLLTILWYGALSWPKLNTYTDTIKPQRTLELTYIHTYIHTYLPTYLPTYLHTYIHTLLLPTQRGFSGTKS